MSTLSKINLNGTQYDIKEKLSSEYTSYNIAYEPLPGDYVETAISKLHKVILDNEYVTVSALTELNDKTVNTIYVNISEDDTTGEISYSSWGYDSTNEIFKSDTQYKLLHVNTTIDNDYKLLNLIGYYYNDNNNLTLIYGRCFAYTDDESFTFDIIEVSENTTGEGDLLNFNEKIFNVPSDSMFDSLYDAVGKNLSTYLQNNQNIIVDNFNRSQSSLNDIHTSDVIKYNNRTYHYIYETELNKTFISFDNDLGRFYSIYIKNNSDSLAYIYDEVVSDPIQHAITSTNKLSADLIEDGETNKVVSYSYFNSWNNKLDKPNYYTINTNPNANNDWHNYSPPYILYNSDNVAISKADYYNLKDSDILIYHISNEESVNGEDIELRYISYYEVETLESKKMCKIFSGAYNNLIITASCVIFTDYQGVDRINIINLNELTTETLYVDLNNPSVEMFDDIQAHYNNSLTVIGEYIDNIQSSSSKLLLPLITVDNNMAQFGFMCNNVSYLITLNSDGTTYINHNNYNNTPASSITAADIANWNSKTSNVGTITGITMNGVSKGTAGVVDLGTVITAHQDISGKQDVITDLDTIRSYAALGATALQNYNETDPVFVRSAAYNITSTDIGNWNSKTSNVGTITGITMNGANKGTSGVVDLGTVITDISGKVDKESGKGLSTNDYTSAEKTKLASINIGDLSNLTTTELNTIFS